MKQKILVSHPWIENGGSEATTMWALQALQDDFDVTLVTAGDVDFDLLNRIFGSQVRSDLVEVIRAPRIPGVNNGCRLVNWQHGVFHRFCRSIANGYDLCISGYNFVPFGKDAIHLLGDFSFSEALREKFYVHGYQKLSHRKSLVRSIYLGVGKIIGGRFGLCQDSDLILANSDWSAFRLKKHCQLDSEVLYPPVLLPSRDAKTSIRNPLGFFYIGRISPEKEVEKIITILDGVREAGFPVTLDLAGNSGSSPYENMISDMVAKRDWIRDLGYLKGDEKEAAFGANSFGLQACQCEAFGIAAAEMAARGCLPLVASDCGAAEVVPHPELQFIDVDDAVVKICALLESDSLTQKLRFEVQEEVSRFSATEFLVNFRNFVDSRLEKKQPEIPHNVVKEQDCPAIH